MNRTTDHDKGQGMRELEMTAPRRDDDTIIGNVNMLFHKSPLIRAVCAIAVGASPDLAAVRAEDAALIVTVFDRESARAAILNLAESIHNSHALATDAPAVVLPDLTDRDPI